MALPYLYLKGLSSGDFGELMPVLLGKDATMGFSANTVLRLRKQWKGEMEQWLRRRLDSKNYVYIWADGVYLSARLEDDKQCLLVIMGTTPEGKKELVGFTTGYRESTQSWRELLLDLKARGLSIPPKLAIGDGAMGFWGALEQIFPATGHHQLSTLTPNWAVFKTKKAIYSTSSSGELSYTFAANGKLLYFDREY
jgi:transposase-like protein